MTHQEFMNLKVGDMVTFRPNVFVPKKVLALVEKVFDIKAGDKFDGFIYDESRHFVTISYLDFMKKEVYRYLYIFPDFEGEVHNNIVLKNLSFLECEDLK